MAQKTNLLQDNPEQEKCQACGKETRSRWPVDMLQDYAMDSTIHHLKSISLVCAACVQVIRSKGGVPLIGSNERGQILQFKRG